jgi:hypothetical protein
VTLTVANATYNATSSVIDSPCAEFKVSVNASSPAFVATLDNLPASGLVNASTVTSISYSLYAIPLPLQVINVTAANFTRDTLTLTSLTSTPGQPSTQFSSNVTQYIINTGAQSLNITAATVANSRPVISGSATNSVSLDLSTNRDQTVDIRVQSTLFSCPPVTSYTVRVFRVLQQLSDITVDRTSIAFDPNTFSYTLIIDDTSATVEFTGSSNLTCLTAPNGTTGFTGSCTNSTILPIPGNITITPFVSTDTGVATTPYTITLIAGKKPNPSSSKGTSKGAIAGAVIGSIIGAALIGVAVFFLLKRRRSISFTDLNDSHPMIDENL